LIVLHAIPVPALQEKRGYREEVEEELGRVGAPDPGVRLERRLVVGDAAARILEAAQAVPCDLIVMGTHGRTGLGRVLLGSVAEQVVRLAPCPVLTVKTAFAEVPPAAEGIGSAVGVT
jgi:nucleotide-binding universal stress UspA family protein